MATAQMSGRHYYISQKRTFMAVQKHIWDILLNFAFSMEDLYKKIVSFLLILLAFDISANAQNVDLSSVDEFLNITTLLKNGEEVNMEQWNQLDSSAAYSLFSNSKDNTILNIVKTAMLDIFGCSDIKGEDQNGSLLETSVRENYEDIKKNYSEIR